MLEINVYLTGRPGSGKSLGVREMARALKSLPNQIEFDAVFHTRLSPTHDWVREGSVSHREEKPTDIIRVEEDD